MSYSTQHRWSMSRINLPSGLTSQLRSSVLVYGPFVDATTLRQHCYADYLELFGSGNTVKTFEQYNRLFTDIVRQRRNYGAELVSKIMKNSRLAAIHPRLAAPESNDTVRTLAYNLTWMIEPSADGTTTSRLHPFLVELVSKAMIWSEGSGFAAVEAYVNRFNTRMACTEGAESKAVTLHQLAPLIVLTVATFANVGIVSYLGIDHRSLPPLEQLYGEAVAALGDDDGPLGRQFVANCCTLVDQLCEPAAKGRVSAAHLPRDPLSGLLLAAHVKREE
ncbi:hypothetical protein H9P43_006780 [Blastocladiella emersonii ATCC 22665]|nr:hypothetical protein H9P43_006780 [Blastocladiella emersonii ATCC 22665]